ncbi:hypothetical protein QZH41_018081, partial [Actinostola sp. cb2023]
LAGCAIACKPPNTKEFPPDLLTQDQRFHGGIVLHLIFSLHIFCALTVVCEDFFVSSLNQISQCLGLKPDVAGATFMAVGSSAPTLFIAIVSIFFTEGDIGLGTIVGSTIFNTLFIIALCCIGAGATLHLAWYPVLRDSSVYIVSVVILMISIYDNKVYWYEGLMFVIVYSIYIVIMYFNSTIEKFCYKMADKCKKKEEKEEKAEDDEEDNKLDEHSTEDWGFHETPASRLYPPEGIFAKLFWGFTLPSIVLFYITIPDCRKRSLRRFYLVTFTIAVLWMAFLSYLLVWMVVIIGYTYTIPEGVMGMTFLAAGSSLPDAIASLVVAKQVTMATLERSARKLGIIHHKPHFYNCSFTKRSVISVLHYNTLFTLEERRNGAVIVHLLISLYCFAALAVLCDHYFCASLEKLCK